MIRSRHLWNSFSGFFHTHRPGFKFMLFQTFCHCSSSYLFPLSSLFTMIQSSISETSIHDGDFLQTMDTNDTLSYSFILMIWHPSDWFQFHCWLLVFIFINVKGKSPPGPLWHSTRIASGSLPALCLPPFTTALVHKSVSSYWFYWDSSVLFNPMYQSTGICQLLYDFTSFHKAFKYILELRNVCRGRLMHTL